MKKKTLQICSVIGLVILTLMTAVSAKAQTRYRAHIPFDFTIGQKSYKAGEYLIGSLNPYAASNTIAIRDAKGRNSHILMVTLGEDYSKVGIATLVFDRYEMQYSLSVIRTPSFTAKLAKSKAVERLAGNPDVQQKMVALTRKN